MSVNRYCAPGVRPFAAADHPRPCWPGAQVEQLGELDDLAVVPDRPVSTDRRLPGVGRDECDGVLDPRIDGQADGVPDPALAAASQERAGRTGAVSPDQDLRTTLVLQAGRGRSGVLGQLLKGQVQDREVVSGGVAAGVTRAQDPGQGFASRNVGAVQEDQQRVEPEAVLVGRGRVLLVTVGGQQRRVHVQDQPSGISEVRSAASDPHPSPSISTGSPEQLELGCPDPVQHPVGRRV